VALFKIRHFSIEISDNKIVGVCLGTRGNFPQFQGDLDIVVKGQFAGAYKNILQKMETQMGESIDVSYFFKKRVPENMKRAPDILSLF